MFNKTDGSPRLIFNQIVQICIKVLETGSYSSNKKELRVWLRIPILESWKGISVNTHLLIKCAAIHTFLSNSKFSTDLRCTVCLLWFWYDVLTTFMVNSSSLLTISLVVIGKQRKQNQIPFLKAKQNRTFKNFVSLIWHTSWFVSVNLSKIQGLNLSASWRQESRKQGAHGTVWEGNTLFPPLSALFIPSALTSRQNGLMRYEDNGVADTWNKRPF